jgi:hypothetical protein
MDEEFDQVFLLVDVGVDEKKSTTSTMSLFSSAYCLCF